MIQIMKSSCWVPCSFLLWAVVIGKRTREGHKRLHHREIGAIRNQEFQRRRFDAVSGDIDQTLTVYETLQREEAGNRRFIASQQSLESAGVYVTSILRHGGIGDGIHDDGPALTASLAEARLQSQNKNFAKIIIHLPGDNHRYYIGAPILISEISDVELRIDGVVLAPYLEQYPQPAKQQAIMMSPEEERMQFAFITLVGVRNLTLSGSGAIDGRGEPWWALRMNDPRHKAPVLILVRDSHDVTIRYLNLYNSSFYHLAILRSRYILVDRLEINSPPLSVNTDGIDVLASSHVHIQDCWISTGDDNLAIKEGSSRVSVQGGTFFRGHGLSIGSLGERGTKASVKHVFLADVTFVYTTNAARIKTWQGGRGTVADITFSHLYVAGVSYPVVIDQFYCPPSQHPDLCANSSHAVKVSNVSVLNLSGWHTSGVAASLHCSQAMPCTLTLADLDLRPAPGCSNVVRCLNVKATPAPPGYTLNSSSLKAPCQHGDEMHGYRIDHHRKGQGRRLAHAPPCIHPP